MSLIEFDIPGRVDGKRRHRARNVRGRVFTYPDPDDKPVIAKIQQAWADAGRSRLGSGPVVLSIRLYEHRPVAHRTSKGELSAVGRREPWPTRKPDLDNVAKQICDALNGLLWLDDKQICDLTISRRWAAVGQEEVAHVTAYALLEEAA